MPIDADVARSLRRASEKQREWTAERDDRIRQAVKAGTSLREVADAVGLSHSAVAKIAKRER